MSLQDGRLKSVKYKGGCKKVQTEPTEPDLDGFDFLTRVVASLPSCQAHQPQRASDHTATGLCFWLQTQS